MFTVQLFTVQMFNIHSTMFTFSVSCSKFMSSVQSSVFNVQSSCPVFSHQCSMFKVQSPLFIIQNSLFRVHHSHFKCSLFMFTVQFNVQFRWSCSGVSSTCLLSISRVLIWQHHDTTTSQAQLLTVEACS